MNDPKINIINKSKTLSPFVRMSGVFMQSVAQV